MLFLDVKIFFHEFLKLKFIKYIVRMFLLLQKHESIEKFPRYKFFQSFFKIFKVLFFTLSSCIF